jgi:hypothetical protein
MKSQVHLHFMECTNSLYDELFKVKTRLRAARRNTAQARGKITDCRRNITTGIRIEKEAAVI